VSLLLETCAHPIVVLHCKFYNIVVAMLGHESYGDPSTGGHEHWLHHQLVDVNFGGNFVPIDWLCGTHVRDEDEFAARAALRDAGRGKKAA
jgi:sterol desaturase/sphingolipid hydroxylase (fatty acid hydroxylase superfamily)